MIINGIASTAYNFSGFRGYYIGHALGSASSRGGGPSSSESDSAGSSKPDWLEPPASPMEAII